MATSVCGVHFLFIWDFFGINWMCPLFIHVLGIFSLFSFNCCMCIGLELAGVIWFLTCIFWPRSVVIARPQDRVQMCNNVCPPVKASMNFSCFSMYNMWNIYIYIRFRGSEDYQATVTILNSVQEQSERYKRTLCRMIHSSILLFTKKSSPYQLSSLYRRLRTRSQLTTDRGMGAKQRLTKSSVLLV